MIKAAAAVFAAAALLNSANATENDPYLWLEEVEGEEALDWVRSQNERSLTELEGDPRFSDLYEEALSVLTSDARLPVGQIVNGKVYNFWQDDNHVRGIWRRSDVDAYRAGEPDWETLIDFDALAEAEDRNWIQNDIICLAPAWRHCMIEISDGGKDAAYWREFDTETKAFVEDGFALPEAKAWLDWIDADTLLVGTDWGEGSLTTSGYPREIRRWTRGNDPADATSIMTVGVEDVWAIPLTEREGDTVHEIVLRGPSFFEREYHYVNDDGSLSALPLPLNADLQGVLNGQAIFLLREDWSYGNAEYAQGSLVAYQFADAAAELIFKLMKTSPLKASMLESRTSSFSILRMCPARQLG